MFSSIGKILGWSSAQSESSDVEAAESRSSSVLQQGEMGNGTLVVEVGENSSKLVRHSQDSVGKFPDIGSSSQHEIQIVDVDSETAQATTFNLDELDRLPAHFEITGSGTEITCKEFRDEEKSQAPSSLRKAYRAMSRTQDQQENYRQGIRNVRSMLLEKYDQNAVDRFDKHFCYRMWAGKPLTVRAIKVFIEQEDDLRQGGVNVSTLAVGAKSLEKLREKLPAEDAKRDYRIIGGGKVPSAAKTDYNFPVLPITRSWFTATADNEDEKRGREEGIDQARKAILSLIKDPTTQQHVEHLFKARFAAKIKSKETLTVTELSVFIDDAVKIRENENGMLGGLYSAARTAQDSGEDVTQAVYKFLKSAYHDLGLAAGAAVVLDQERNTNDPIMGLAKGFAAGALVASENDTERILTAAAEHFIATPAAAPQTSITSRILKFFTFGLY